MDDLMGKIQEMLSDEESMKQISELAQMFSSSDNTETKSSESPSKPDNTETDFRAVLQVSVWVILILQKF